MKTATNIYEINMIIDGVISNENNPPTDNIINIQIPRSNHGRLVEWFNLWHDEEELKTIEDLERKSQFSIVGNTVNVKLIE